MHGHEDGEGALRFPGSDLPVHGAVRDLSPGEPHADECTHDEVYERSHDDDEMHGHLVHGRTHEEIGERSPDDDDPVHGHRVHGLVDDDVDEQPRDDDLAAYGRDVHGYKMHGREADRCQVHGCPHDEIDE